MGHRQRVTWLSFVLKPHKCKSEPKHAAVGSGHPSGTPWLCWEREGEGVAAGWVYMHVCWVGGDYALLQNH